MVGRSWQILRGRPASKFVEGRAEGLRCTYPTQRRAEGLRCTYPKELCSVSVVMLQLKISKFGSHRVAPA